MKVHTKQSVLTWTSSTARHSYFNMIFLNHCKRIKLVFAVLYSNKKEKKCISFCKKSVKRPADTNDTFACQAEENAASFLLHLSFRLTIP